MWLKGNYLYELVLLGTTSNYLLTHSSLAVLTLDIGHWSVWSGHFCDFETYSDTPNINLEGWDIYFPYTTGTHIQYITRIHFI